MTVPAGITAPDEPDRADVDVLDTSRCPVLDECETCSSTDDLAVIVTAGDDAAACITVCPACATDPSRRRGLSMAAVWGRAAEHASEHLELNGDVVRAVLAIRNAGQVVDPHVVAHGPYTEAPTELAWFVRGARAVDPDPAGAPARTAAWLRAALGAAEVVLADADHEAIELLALLGPTTAQVIADWARRAAGSHRAGHVSLDRAVALAVRRRAMREEAAAAAARAAAEPEPPRFAPDELRGVDYSDRDAIFAQLADEQMDASAARLEQRFERWYAERRAREQAGDAASTTDEGSDAGAST